MKRKEREGERVKGNIFSAKFCRKLELITNEVIEGEGIWFNQRVHKNMRVHCISYYKPLETFGKKSWKTVLEE